MAVACSWVRVRTQGEEEKTITLSLKRARSGSVGSMSRHSERRGDAEGTGGKEDDRREQKKQ